MYTAGIIVSTLQSVQITTPFFVGTHVRCMVYTVASSQSQPAAVQGKNNIKKTRLASCVCYRFICVFVCCLWLFIFLYLFSSDALLYFESQSNEVGKHRAKLFHASRLPVCATLLLGGSCVV